MSDKIKAVIVRLGIGVFSNTRQDPNITNEVRLKKALGEGAGKWVKHKFPEEAFQLIRKTAGEIRRKHYDYTLPWEDGQRLLPYSAKPKYDEMIETDSAIFWQQVDEFGDNFDKWYAEAKKMHGKTFNPGDYPDWKKMRTMFGVSVEYTPMPKANHFIGGLAKDEIEEMKVSLETRTEQRIEEAKKDIWNRLLTPVKTMADKLTGKDTIFRDTLVENVKEIVELVPVLNLTGDESLHNAAQEIKERLSNLDPETLRTDSVVRKEVAEAAKKIASRFGAIGKRRFA